MAGIEPGSILLESERLTISPRSTTGSITDGAVAQNDTWSCELEKATQDGLSSHSCADGFAPLDPQGRAQFYNYDSIDSATTVEEYIRGRLAEIDHTALKDVSQSSVKFQDDILTNEYSYAVRATTTQIGCTKKVCTDEGMFAIYCLTDQKALTNGEIIYEVGTAGQCTDCPSGTACDPTSKLCVVSDSSATAGTVTTTPAATGTTTLPTSPEAGFPTGASTKCPNSRMTDTLRDEYVRLHNFRRSLLATGQIPRKDGKLLPTASNMQRITYDCNMEEGAIQWAAQCPKSNSPQNFRPGVGENFREFPATKFTFDTAAKKSVTEWWKPIRDVNYFEKVVVFRPFHEGAPISSFTQMGWATSNKLGCSIVKCATSNRYVAVCRYSPGGNIVNSNVYTVGSVCSACPSGSTSCSPNEGLC
ncbi:hypothetical protein Y032_0005g2390 [Ancylostoma ceylanicum]|uniref:SCP domain-containing protein n=1 Tax=Ancylostoma ceylanicum TaxID=53326 RepID=A0A016VTD0_9BILA|nr:hypothetical protein Y032_0005g2390 [Ancylostoma ceylanicum]